jgi:hypothetical protein
MRAPPGEPSLPVRVVAVLFDCVDQGNEFDLTILCDVIFDEEHLASFDRTS